MIIDLVRFLCPHFSTPRFDLSHCLFLFFPVKGSSFGRFQGIFDDPRLDGAAGKGTYKSLQGKGQSMSCIKGVFEFGKSCATSFLLLNYFLYVNGALAGGPFACVEGTR